MSLRHTLSGCGFFIFASSIGMYLFDAENITFSIVKRLLVYRLLINAQTIVKSQGENMKTTCTIVAMLTLCLFLGACNLPSTVTPSPTLEALATSTPEMEKTGTPPFIANPTRLPLTSLTLNAAQNSNLGLYLIDDQGMTVYLHATDTMNVSTCKDECATEWPPLLIAQSVKVMSGPGLDATRIGAIIRDDGGTQVTYNGWPLYYYNRDVHPGDVTGHGVNDFFAVSPSGNKIEK